MKERDVRIGRILHEDDDFVTIEVAKRLEKEIRIEEGDQLVTIAFMPEVTQGWHDG